MSVTFWGGSELIFSHYDQIQIEVTLLPVHPSPDQFSGQAQKFCPRHDWDSGQLGHVSESESDILEKLEEYFRETYRHTLLHHCDIHCSNHFRHGTRDVRHIEVVNCSECWN